MTTEELEELRLVMGLPGFKIIMRELDAIVENVKQGVHGCSLSNDPAKDGQNLLMARMKYEGSVATKNALTVKLESYKEKRR